PNNTFDILRPHRPTDGKVQPEFAYEPIQPIPLTSDITDQRIVELGRELFEDRRLSADNTISCAHCHPLENAGVDGLRFSIGIGGAVGDINAPTVYNSGLFFVQFWDGRAATLEEQVSGPINNPKELGTNWDQVIKKLRADDNYVKAFSEIYPKGITTKSVSNAIATFERSLLTPNSRFDQFLRGKKDAITEEEVEGYFLFKSYGCSSCHQGVAVGGNMFEKMGVHGDYFTDRGGINKADFGRFNVTGVEEDRHEFKVPSLRNIALTAPYFHDGSKDTLEDAVAAMAKYQLGRPMRAEDVKSIVGFLKTLTGELNP
ncbi:cytochrome-c peroxidase, partial [Pseudomonadota bacterium]